jgi:hypothetical protein
MSRGDPCKNVFVLNGFGKIGFGKAVKLRPGYNFRFLGSYVKAFCNRKGGFGVVAGYHDRSDARFFTFEHRFRRTLSWWIHHSEKAEEAKAFFRNFFGIRFLISQRDYPKGTGGHF